MKTAILLAGYGASNLESREGLRGFENHCRCRFPDLPIRWAFTSMLARDRMARLRQKSDSIAKALMRLKFERFDAVAIQPLQSIAGREYEELAASVEKVKRDTGLACSVGAPLMQNEQDIDLVVQAFATSLPLERQKHENILFMAHGAKHSAGVMYEKLADAVNSAYPGVYLAAMSGKPHLETILPELSAQVVWLMPLLSVIGAHALRDMAGSAETSWKSRLEANGKICRPVLKGMTQGAGFASIWLDNLARAIENLN